VRAYPDEPLVLGIPAAPAMVAARPLAPPPAAQAQSRVAAVASRHGVEIIDGDQVSGGASR